MYTEAQQRAHIGSGKEYMAMIEESRPDDKVRRERTRIDEMKTEGDRDKRKAGRTIRYLCIVRREPIVA